MTQISASGTNHCGAAVLTGGLPNIIAVSGLQHCNIDITWGFWFIRGQTAAFLRESDGPMDLMISVALRYGTGLLDLEHFG